MPRKRVIVGHGSWTPGDWPAVDPLDAGTITATVAGATQVDLAFSTPPSGGAGAVLGYTYQWHRDTTPGFTPVPGTALTGFTSDTESDTSVTEDVTYHYQCVVTDADSNSASTNEVTATPKASTAIFERNFTTETEDGWTSTDFAGSFDVIASAESTDGANLGRMVFPQGMGSQRPAVTAKSTGWSAGVVRIKFRFKVSDNWQNNGSGTNKILYVTDSSTSGAGDPAFVKLHGPGGAPNAALELRIQLQSRDVPNRTFSQNVGSGAISRGTWYEFEVLLKYQSGPTAQDGEAHAWINGTKVIEYTDVQWSAYGDRTFDSVRWEPYWGGQHPDPVAEEQYQYMDYIRVYDA